MQTYKVNVASKGHKGVCLGKHPKRVDKRTFKLADYLVRGAPLPPIPPKASYMQKIAAWPMDLNDRYGDCVIAAMAHMIQQWTMYSSGVPVVLTDAQVLAGYEAIGGYVPGDESTDNGCDMLTALNYWRRVGLGGHKIYAFAEVNMSDLQEVELAISLFGNCFTGLALPVTAQQQEQCWIVTDPSRQTAGGQPGSWGGHCIATMMYDSQAAGLVTWGEVMWMTPNFIRCYADEGYAVLSPDWIEKRGVTPSHFNFTQLKTDLAQI